MTAETLLQRLDGVWQTGPGRWLAKCPGHEDTRASLSVREMPDGRVLVYDFAGCGAADVIAAVGLEFADLFPPRDLREYERGRYVQHRVAFDAVAALHSIAHEAAVVAMIAGEIAMSDPAHADRALEASRKIHQVLSAIPEPRDVPELKALRRGEGRAA